MLKNTQNFLVNHNLINRLVQKTSIMEGETVIDLGAGEGIITEAILKKLNGTGTVVAIELDPELYEGLMKRFGNSSNVKVLNEDITKFELPQIPYKVVSNIPFNVTSIILNKILAPDSKLVTADLVLQEEAAMLWAGEQVLNENSLKSLLIYPLYETSITYHFESHDFIPEPNVSIVFLNIKRRDTSLVELKDIDSYRNFITYISQDRAGEGSWRKVFSKKQLSKLYSNSLIIPQKGIKNQNASGLIEAFKIYNLTASPERKKELALFAERKYELDNKISKINRTR